VRRSFRIWSDRSWSDMMNSNGSRQKVILVTEVKSCIKQGFEYVASLPDGSQLDKLICARKIMLDLYRI